MRSILGTLRNVALSGLALSAAVACGGEVSTGESSSGGSSGGASSGGGGGGSSGNPGDGYLRVECRDGTRVTDLAGVREELGLDYIGVLHADYVASDAPPEKTPAPRASAEGGPSCTSEPCSEEARKAVDAAQLVLAQPNNGSPWADRGMAGSFAIVLLTAKDGVYESITDGAQLRKRLGALDKPWKAHLWALMTSSFDVSCKPYAGYTDGAEVDANAYVSRTAAPTHLIGVAPAPGCSNDAKSYRVNFSLDVDGNESEESRTQIWEGSTACEGRIPDALSRMQLQDVLRDSSTSEGAYFARMAYFEAAAVHAFATLLDELAAHDLPAELRRDLERARQDEVRHARMMTTLARRHGHEPEVPTLAPCAPRSLEAIALENAVEGCVRETYGAVVGLYQARHAQRASVRKAMRALAEDELFHADLSWRLGAWLEAQLDDDARARVRHARDEAIAAQRNQLHSTPSIDTLGLPTPEIALAMHEQLHQQLWAA